jgi:uncharacterized membrane protein
MRGAARVTAHVLLFVLAIAVFYIGLGIGLQHNPTIGSVLWFAAAAIAGLNLIWLMRWRRKPSQPPQS